MKKYVREQKQKEKYGNSSKSTMEGEKMQGKGKTIICERNQGDEL